MTTEVARRSAGSTATAGVRERGHIAFAQLSTNSVHRTAQGSTHSALLEDEQFASITTRAITDVVRATRSGQPLR